MNLRARVSSCLQRVVIAVVLAPLVLLVQPANAQTWSLAWSDEFNDPAGTTPNSNNWTFMSGNNFMNSDVHFYCVPGSNTQPCSTAKPNLFMDGSGHLVIRAISVPTQALWTTGGMTTANHFMPQYGKIEARMKLTVGNGLWPQFWMLGSNNLTGTSWPTCGEADIMEWVPQFTPAQTSATIFGPGYTGCCGNSAPRYAFPSGGRVDDAGYHVYGVVWQKDRVAFYRDDNPPFATMTASDIPTGSQWVFNQPFYIVLNLQVGGSFPTPGPDATTPNPSDVVVDWVRVYQPAGPTPTVTRTSTPTATATARPTPTGTPVAVKMNAGGPVASPYVADAFFSGGSTINHANTIDLTGVTNPAPMAVYQTARTGTFTYTIPGFVAGSSHTVRLHFAETYFSSAGSRVFNVTLNGTRVLTSFDVFAAAGAKNKAVVRSFTTPANASGQIVVQTGNVTNLALVSGIEIQ
jgi:beta-glucanase (GH16 family)